MSIHVSTLIFGQDYTAYLTGQSSDTITQAGGGICLMGGATESDEAMQWFLNRANGGDVLILRASGSDGYNDYFYSELGINLNSVETIVFENAIASSDSYIHQKITQAEAIWFAGGDQSKYISFWKGTPIQTLINEAIKNRNIVIGGTSAGMAILGEYYFSAANGTISSDEALANPYNEKVTIDSTAFLDLPALRSVITDTHYDDRQRKGRHIVFLSRVIKDFNASPMGIACDEYTAVCVDENNHAYVFGDYPTYDDNAYFITANCNLSGNTPEICEPEKPLTWNKNASALMVYRIKGTIQGENFIKLDDWNVNAGGEWFYWSVENGSVSEYIADDHNCSTSTSVLEDLQWSQNKPTVQLFPNPTFDSIEIKSEEFPINRVDIVDSTWKVVLSKRFKNATLKKINISSIPSGKYTALIYNKHFPWAIDFVKIEGE